MRIAAVVLAALSLIVCTGVAFAYFQGSITMPEYKAILLVSSILYFVFATVWATRPAGGAQRDN